MIDAIGPVAMAGAALQLLGDSCRRRTDPAYGVMRTWEARRSDRASDRCGHDRWGGLHSVGVLRDAGGHHPERSTNLFDGGAPFYNVYECADGRYLSVALIEGHSYAQFLALIASATPNCPSSTTGTVGPNSLSGSLT